MNCFHSLNFIILTCCPSTKEISSEQCQIKQHCSVMHIPVKQNVVYLQNIHIDCSSRKSSLHSSNGAWIRHMNTLHATSANLSGFLEKQILIIKAKESKMWSLKENIWHFIGSSINVSTFISVADKGCQGPFETGHNAFYPVISR